MTSPLENTDHLDATVRPGRWEILRALGAFTMVTGGSGHAVARSLGLVALTRAEHTDLFVLLLPPYAALHLGPEGQLGGEGADRVAGVWRVLGLDPPSDADHLGRLLALYAELGEAEEHTTIERTQRRLRLVRATLLWEHLWSWTPGYLAAAAREEGAAQSWAQLATRVLVRETRLTPGATDLALALRVAPDPIDEADDLDQLLDALTAPVRTGFVLTYRDLGRASDELGVGLRRGERHYALRAMVEQDARGTMGWLSRHALVWEALHRRAPRVPYDPGAWWSERAARSALVLQHIADQGS